MARGRKPACWSRAFHVGGCARGACLALADYALRDETRRQHQLKLLSAFGWKTIDSSSSSNALAGRDETAWDLDQSVSLLPELLGQLRPRGILKPWMAELERLAAARPHRAWVGAGINVAETK